MHAKWQANCGYCCFNQWGYYYYYYDYYDYFKFYSFLTVNGEKTEFLWKVTQQLMRELASVPLTRKQVLFVCAQFIPETPTSSSPLSMSSSPGGITPGLGCKEKIPWLLMEQFGVSRKGVPSLNPFPVIHSDNWNLTTDNLMLYQHCLSLCLFKAATSHQEEHQWLQQRFLNSFKYSGNWATGCSSTLWKVLPTYFHRFTLKSVNKPDTIYFRS